MVRANLSSWRGQSFSSRVNTAEVEAIQFMRRKVKRQQKRQKSFIVGSTVAEDYAFLCLVPGHLKLTLIDCTISQIQVN